MESIRINSIDDSQVASEQPTELRPTVVSGGRELCSNCGAPLAADQRYCTECGQRRGAPRFPFMEAVGERTREVVVAPPPRPRFTPNSTLIAGIGTLLLAMGIGVLIGRTGNNSSPKSAGPVQVLTVPGGATGAAGAATAGTTSTPTTPAASAAAGAATAKATHTSTKGTFTTKAPPPKVVTVGGSCTGGRGCQGGKFTGNFFGQ